MTANRRLSLVQAKTSFGKLPLGPDLSSPVVAKGRIFLTNSIGATKQLATLCLDQRTGKILWRRTVAPSEIEKVHEISSPAAPTPASDGERVYVYFGSYGLVSYDFDGKLLWERRLPLSQNIYGQSPPRLLRATCWCSTIRVKTLTCSPSIAATARPSGRTDRSRFQYGWSTPVYWRHDGSDEILVLGGDFGPNQRLMAYDLADGAERWWVAGLPPCGKSTPVIGRRYGVFRCPRHHPGCRSGKEEPGTSRPDLCKQRVSRNGSSTGWQR